MSRPRRAQQALGWAWEQQGDRRQALEHATLALHLFQSLDNLVWQADILNDVGWYAAQLGEYDQARAQCGFALMLHRHQDNRDGEATALEALGYIAHRTGQHAHAVDYYQQALTLLRDLGHAYKEARALENLGHPLVVLGHFERARAVWQDAVELDRLLRHSSISWKVQRATEQIIIDPSRTGLFDVDLRWNPTSAAAHNYPTYPRHTRKASNTRTLVRAGWMADSFKTRLDLPG